MRQREANSKILLHQRRVLLSSRVAESLEPAWPARTSAVLIALLMAPIAACGPEVSGTIRMKAAAFLALLARLGSPAMSDANKLSSWQQLLPELFKLGGQGPLHTRMVGALGQHGHS